MNGFDKAEKKMDNNLLRKPALIGYLCGNDEGNSDFFKGDEGRYCVISARRGKKFSLFRKVQAQVHLTYNGPVSEEAWKFFSKYPDNPHGK